MTIIRFNKLLTQVVNNISNTKVINSTVCFVSILLFCSMASCSGKQNLSSLATNEANTHNQNKAVNLVKLVQPKSEITIKDGDSFTIEYTIEDNNITIDSAHIVLNGKLISTFTEQEFNFTPSNMPMGRQSLIITVYSGGTSIGTASYNFIIKPKNAPKLYSYQIIKEYPHKTNAYTQGLYFDKGVMYESTGQYGQSSLRKVNFKTGEVLQNISLDKKYFGEGACVLNGKIYQLTWQERTGLIYNADNLEQIGTFNYGTEGWGITTDGKNLIMSDGTHRLFFINPDNMSIAKQLEVYSDAGAIQYINELEYINGEIWANVYTEDVIIRINPENGEVTGIIHMNNLLKPSDYKQDTDVLNGIAYNAINNAIYVTGKNWPKLFEIKLIEK